ncbi:MAG: DUF2207 domain-containing protein [Thermodesulfovibrionales bacterium]|nr:DUF2207 domain-containing protein [Thermodesulfovibrionales bacterium]
MKGKDMKDFFGIKPLRVIGMFLFFILVGAVAYAQDFTINNFHSDIIIREDSSFTVKETIVVEFHRQRHGIYREIPFRYKDELGKTIITPLKVLSVTDEAGRDLKYKLTRPGDVINIRIGDPKKYVAGIQTYVITYKAENAILFFHDHDELYWNVTGNFWKASIKDASASVMLMTEKDIKDFKTACYTGIYGSREARCGSRQHLNITEFSALKALHAGEGLTIVLGWGKGITNPPSAWKRFLWAINIKENWVFALPIISFIFMISHWSKRGRDPKVRASVTVMYEPPEHNKKPLTPAEVGAVVDERLDPRDITSTIVGLGVKGYLKIEEQKTEILFFDITDYRLTKLREPDKELSPIEKVLMENIFSLVDSTLVSDMKNKFYKNLPLLKEILFREILDKGYFLKSPEKIRGVYIAAGIAAMLLTGFLTAFLLPYVAFKGIFAGILTGIPVMGFSGIMPAKTKAGALAHMHILGFQEFLNRAEKDRLERMGDKSLFSKFLPYALALDVADNWAKAFEGIYQEPPEWYVSSGGFRGFNAYGFSRSIDSMSSNLSSAMFSAPRGSGGSSSGGGGGGSSGGGFGGGGGGSW